jgi:hypothetical protein
MPRYIRVYRCPDCGHKWRTESKLGFLEPDCPQCGFHPDPLPVRMGMPAIIGTKAKAVDEAYRVASEDYGLTNLRDNSKEGETAFIPPVMPAQPPANIVLPGNAVQQAGGFMWGHGGSGKVAPQIPVANVLASAKAAARLNDAQDANPMTKLHQARPTLTAHSLGRFNRR